MLLQQLLMQLLKLPVGQLVGGQAFVTDSCIAVMGRIC